MADPVTNGVRNISMQGTKQIQGEDEGVIVSPLDAMNGHTEDAPLPDDTARQLTLDEQAQGQGQDMVSPPSQDHGDSKYEFDPVSTGSSSAPLSPPETTDSSSGMFVDFDGVAKHVHEASTASVSPQSPDNFSSDPFAMENKENSNPMTSSMIAGDPMTSSFMGDFLPDSSQANISEDASSSQVCDYNVNDLANDVSDDVTSALPPGGPTSVAALQEIGVYGAPPPEETGAPLNDLVCLDEDGMQMPTTQAPTVPPSNNALPSNAFSSNPFSDSLINTQAPMGQFDPFKAEVNGAQSANPFDSIPGQPPIGFTPPLQPKEAFVDPAPPLMPSMAPTTAPSAPGGPSMQEPMAPVQAPVPSPPFSMPPKNEPLFTHQPLPDVTDVKVTERSNGQDALLLEDVKTENGPSAPVVPPIDLSSFDPNAPEVKPEEKPQESPKKPPSPTKKTQEEKKSPRKAQSQAIPDSTKIPSPKRAKPIAATGNKKALPAKANNATATNNKAPAKKVAATPAKAPANKAAPTPAKSSPRGAPPAPAKQSPRTPAPAKTSPRAPAPTRQPPRAPAPTKPAPRAPVKKSPRATKDGASDSGIEDEKASPRKSTPTTTKTPPKKYGTDSVANLKHKPGGGNVKIFHEKVTIKKVAPRTDCKPSPRPALSSPRSSTSSKSSTPLSKSTPSPNTKNVSSKIGSTANIKHTPGGGNVKITHAKQDLSNVRSKCGTMDNVKHTPRGGEKKIESQKVEWKVQSRVGSLDNAKHKAGGGEKKIETQKLEFRDKAQSKVGSKDNIKHKAGGGDKQIETAKLEWKAESKVGSMDYVNHQAGGGDKKIETAKLDWKAESKVGSMDYVHHQAGGGDKEIETNKLDWKAESKVGSLDHVHHQAGGGEREIETHKLEFREKAQSKVGSKDNIKHQAGGGDKPIETHKLDFKEKAQARTDTGFVSGSGSQGGSQYTGSDSGSVGAPASPVPAAE